MDNIRLHIGKEAVEDKVEETFGAVLRHRLYVAMPSAVAESATTSEHDDVPTAQLTIGVDRETLELLSDKETMSHIAAASQAHAHAAAGIQVDWESIIEGHIVH